MIEITPFIDKTRKMPLYLQLYHYIKKEIESNNLQSGVKLPSIRILSEHLQLSKNTVETAYEQLIAEGYIESRPRRGLFISNIRTDLLLSQTQDIPKPRKATERHYTYDFHYGDIAFDAFPHKVWRKFINEALDSDPKKIFNYGYPQGSYELRAEITRYVYQARGINCIPEQVMIHAGTQQSISFLCQLLQLYRSDVAIENPGYDGVRSVFANHNCLIHPIPLETDGIIIEKLIQSKANVAYVTPSHQFPYGMVLPIQKRLELLEWASTGQRFIIEDDYDSEFRYQGNPIPSLKALDQNDKVIYLGTFSKSFLPSIRISYIILPMFLIERFKNTFQKHTQSNSPFLQHALYLFMKNGEFSRHVRKMRKIYKVKHQTLIQAIDEYMHDQVEVIGQKAGLHVLLDVKHKKSEHLIKQAREMDVRVYSPKNYWYNPLECPDSYIMLGFGGLTEKEIREGIRVLGKVWFNS